MNYNKLKVVQLRNQLKKRGLDTSGLKPQLVQRLKDDDIVKTAEPKGKENEPVAIPEETKASGVVAHVQDEGKGKEKEKKKEKEKEEKEEEIDVEKSTPNKRTLSKTLQDMKDEGAKKRKTRQPKVDPNFLHSGEVYKDYDCMLNQTDIKHNHNKFYVIQLIESGSEYYVFNRWGNSLSSFSFLFLLNEMK